MHAVAGAHDDRCRRHPAVLHTVQSLGDPAAVEVDPKTPDRADLPSEVVPTAWAEPGADAKAEVQPMLRGCCEEARQQSTDVGSGRANTYVCSRCETASVRPPSKIQTAGSARGRLARTERPRSEQPPEHLGAWSPCWSPSPSGRLTVLRQPNLRLHRPSCRSLDPSSPLSLATNSSTAEGITKSLPPTRNVSSWTPLMPSRVQL